MNGKESRAINRHAVSALTAGLSTVLFLGTVNVANAAELSPDNNNGPVPAISNEQPVNPAEETVSGDNGNGDKPEVADPAPASNSGDTNNADDPAPAGSPATEPVPASVSNPALASVPNETAVPEDRSNDEVAKESGGFFAVNFFEDKISIDDFVEKCKTVFGDGNYEVDESVIDGINKSNYGPERKPSLKEIKVKKDGKELSLKVFNYKPSYATTDKNGTPKTHTHHNTGKLNVKNPNDYTLNKDQKTKIINDFKKANANLGLDDAEYKVDSKGNLSIKKDKNTYIVPSDNFISDIGYVEDIIVFHAIGEKTTRPIEKPIVINVKKGKDYKELWGSNAVRNGEGDTKGLEFKLDKDAGTVTISGTYTGNGEKPNRSGNRYEIWGKYGIGINVDKFNGTVGDYKNSYSNIFRVRILRVKNQSIIRCVDDKAKHISLDNEVKPLLNPDWDALKAYNGPDDANGLNDTEKVRKAVKARVDQVISEKNPTLEHKVGTQNFKANIKLKDQNDQLSPDITVTTIYYTEKIANTLVSNPTKLTKDEQNAIKDKVKEANKDLNLTDDDITVDDKGNIKIKVVDPNSKDKSGKTEVKFVNPAPLITAKYEDQTVTPGREKESSVVVNKGKKPSAFPDGTTFKTEGAPEGISVDKDGKVTYKVPEGFDFGTDEKKEITGNILVTVPGQDTPTKVPYKFIVEKASFAKVIYILKSDQDADKPNEIDAKFRLDNEDKYPKTIEGEKNTAVPLDFFGENGKKAPKFIGYKYENLAIKGQNTKFNQKGEAVLRVLYSKIDEIVSLKENEKAPEGYVKVTFIADKNS